MFLYAELFREEDLASAVDCVASKFSNDIERIGYSVSEDWSGDPSLFFHLLLKDEPGTIYDHESLEKKGFFALCNRIVIAITDAVRDTHLQPYFDFRFVSEQEELRDPGW